MTALRFERLTAPAGLPVTSAEIAEALRVADDLLTEAATLHVPAAVAELQDYAGLAFLTQTVRAIARGPLAPGQALRLPIGPVLAGAACTVTVRAHDGTEATLDAGLWRLIAGKRPELRLLDLSLPSTLAEDSSELLIDYAAGFGSTATAVPRDLKIAVLDQSIRLFDRRGDDFTRGATPVSAHAARIVSRWRGVSL